MTIGEEWEGNTACFIITYAALSGVLSELLAFARKVLQSQPFSLLLGTQLELFEAGKAVLSLELRDELKQQHGFAHGGVISYLADNALTFAGGSVLGDSLTSEYKINYLRPATGRKLGARAWVVYSGKKQAVCQCEVYAVSEEGERMIAVAQGTIHKVEPKT